MKVGTNFGQSGWFLALSIEFLTFLGSTFSKMTWNNRHIMKKMHQTCLISCILIWKCLFSNIVFIPYMFMSYDWASQKRKYFASRKISRIFWNWYVIIDEYLIVFCNIALQCFMLFIFVQKMHTPTWFSTFPLATMTWWADLVLGLSTDNIVSPCDIFHFIHFYTKRRSLSRLIRRKLQCY